MDFSTSRMIKSTFRHAGKGIPGVENEVHRKYGLRITHFRRRAEIPARNNVTPRQFPFYSLCHLFEGEGWYWAPDQGMVKVRSGDAVLVTPQVVMDYGAKTGNWVEDFICFVGPMADYLMDAGVLESGVLPMGNTRRLCSIIETAMDPSDDAQISANSQLQKLLVDLYLENRPSELEGKEKVVEELRHRLVRDCKKWWTVEEMAEDCGMSVNHMRNLFKDQTGITPKAFVENLKIKQAAERLSQTQISIGSISSEFGYRDPYHFSRVFKKVMGMSPQAYRKAQKS